MLLKDIVKTPKIYSYLKMDCKQLEYKTYRTQFVIQMNSKILEMMFSVENLLKYSNI